MSDQSIHNFLESLNNVEEASNNYRALFTNELI